MTQEQNEQSLGLTHRKPEAEVATAEEGTRLRAAAEEESKLWRKMMVKESEALVAAAATAALAPARAAPPPWRITTEADDIMGQVPPEVMNITLRFAGLPRCV